MKYIRITKKVFSELAKPNKETAAQRVKRLMGKTGIKTILPIDSLRISTADSKTSEDKTKTPAADQAITVNITPYPTLLENTTGLPARLTGLL